MTVRKEIDKEKETKKGSRGIKSNYDEIKYVRQKQWGKGGGGKIM
jgi:hypothetical protein